MRNPPNAAGAAAIQKLIKTYGCLPEAPDGPTLEKFDAIKLAEAIDQELERGRDYGFSKITLHMDCPDAYLLSQFLRMGNIGKLYISSKDLNSGNTNPG